MMTIIVMGCSEYRLGDKVHKRRLGWLVIHKYLRRKSATAEETRANGSGLR